MAESYDPVRQRTRRQVLVALGGLAAVACDGQAGAAASAAPKADAGAGGDIGGGDTAAASDSGAAIEVGPVDTATAELPTATDAPATDAATGDAASPYANEGVAISPLTKNPDHYITSCCPAPKPDAATWKLQFLDRGKPLTAFTLAELEALAALDREHTLECIGTGPGGQAISNAVWRGLPVDKLLATRGLQLPKAAYLKVTALDGFSTGLPATDLAKPLWVVWRMNGEPLPTDHGFPARMLVPGRYGMKNPKWLATLDFVDEPYLGYWEKLGWSDTALYQPNAFIAYPGDKSTLKVGLTRVQGTAYAGSDPIAKVEVRVNGGAWQPAVLDYQKGPDVWTLWHFDLPLSAGTWTIQARCTAQSGKASDLNPEGSDPMAFEGYDGSMQVSVTVA
ncbi:MAG: molybdopterin-dependent oxidoreductase [Deltaproteobacteria bacterium]|nr:molybdopterin-dependent oxidoreductase [Deltaproteobacteria bacterium]